MINVHILTSLVSANVLFQLDDLFQAAEELILDIEVSFFDFSYILLQVYVYLSLLPDLAYKIVHDLLSHFLIFITPSIIPSSWFNS